MRSDVKERTEELLQALDQDPAASLEDVVFLNRFKDRLEARIVRGLREVDRTRAWQAEGATSLPAWLRWRCRLLPGQAAEKAALARHLDQLPQTSKALSDGRIGYQHAAEIARTAELIGAEPVRRQEAVLVKAARDLDPHRFRYVTRHLRYCENPDGSLKEENENHRQRWLTFSQTWNGEFHLEGRLDAEGGAIVLAWGPPPEGWGMQRRWRATCSRWMLAIACFPPNDGPTRWWSWPASALAARSRTST